MRTWHSLSILSVWNRKDKLQGWIMGLYIMQIQNNECHDNRVVKMDAWPSMNQLEEDVTMKRCYQEMDAATIN